jgi:sugar phosphate isomerase/epimerase
MTPCIAQATTLAGSFADDLENYPAAGCRVLEVWLTKLEQHLETTMVAATRQQIADRGLTLAAAAYQGGLLLSQGQQRQAHFDQFKRRLELCQALDIPTLILVPDFVPQADPQAVPRAIVSLTQAARWAAAFGVRLALEFRGNDPVCSCLETALTLVAHCGESNVGVCLDAFHYYKGPSKPEDLGRVTAANLAHVQLCDVAGVPRELMTDADRVMPGDGDFRLDGIVGRLREIGYTGAVSLELLNPVLWQANAKQVVELGLTALDRVLAPVKAGP